ncbi:hypothetical protein HOF65_05990 [bacterium]|jgi:hypothetical protein|nr:hypothetical protein [bacterium]
MKGVTSPNQSIAFASSDFAFGHSTISGFHTVSPTFASLIDFKPVTMYHIDQFHIFLSLVYHGEKYHTSRASIFLFVFKKYRVSHFFISH